LIFPPCIQAYLAALVYPLRQAYPLSTFAETGCLGLQSAVIFSAVCTLQHRDPAPLVLASAAALSAFAYLVTAAPSWCLALVQAASTATMTVALLPQLAKNFKGRTSGGWSPISAGLSTAGNAIRVFTTMQLTHDMLLLAGFGAGFLLNAILLAQTLAWPAGTLKGAAQIT
jgi:mannose-P-dolichol utilization defect protein 1